MIEHGFAFLAGLGVGFIIAFGLAANASVTAIKKSLASGMIEQSGVVYRVTRLDP